MNIPPAPKGGAAHRVVYFKDNETSDTPEQALPPTASRWNAFDQKQATLRNAPFENENSMEAQLMAFAR